MNLRGAKPVNDNRIKEFLQTVIPTQICITKILQKNPKQNFDWINSSGNNTLTGLEYK